MPLELVTASVVFLLGGSSLAMTGLAAVVLALAVSRFARADLQRGQ